ncbi:hypothetical protein Bbelb_168170 [Branchiostoma belcheri]|nr:hypothetical protein Bbelb_168170 [Branchiostoma belcheri]
MANRGHPQDSREVSSKLKLPYRRLILPQAASKSDDIKIVQRCKLTAYKDPDEARSLLSPIRPWRLYLGSGRYAERTRQQAPLECFITTTATSTVTHIKPRERSQAPRETTTVRNASPCDVRMREGLSLIAEISDI